MSELRTNRIIPRDGLTSGTGIAGGIIQIKQTILKSQFTVSQNVNSGYTDLTGLSVAITPTRSDSKVLVRAVIYNSIASNNVIFFRLLRGSTFIEQPSGTSSSGANFNAHAFSYYDASYQDSTSLEILDEPATTSATTYKIQVAATNNGSPTITINKFVGTNNYYGISTITAMEVSG
jgi:hypothetical protein